MFCANPNKGKISGFVDSGLGIWSDEQVGIYRGRLVAIQEVIFPRYDFDNIHLNNFSFDSKGNDCATTNLLLNKWQTKRNDRKTWKQIWLSRFHIT